MPGFSGTGAAAGAGTGAAVGTGFLPGWGTLIGAVVGAGAGGFGLNDNAPTPNYRRVDALYTRRRQEIGDFSAQLAAARQKYMSSLTNMYQNAFSNFVPIAETKFANRGLSPIGGAYQSALARETANYQAQLAPKEAEWERADAQAVDQAYAGAAGMQTGANQMFPMAQYTAQNQNDRNIGNFAMSGINQWARGGGGGQPESYSYDTPFSSNYGWQNNMGGVYAGVQPGTYGMNQNYWQNDRLGLSRPGPFGF